MVKLSTYSPLDSLVDLACRDGVDVRPTLLRVITDLYVQKQTHTAEEERQYVELMLGLISAADEATRATVAARLGAYANAPRAVLHRLTGAPAEPAAAPQPHPHAASPIRATAEERCEPWAVPASTPASAPVYELIELFFSAGAEERRMILVNLDAVAGPTLRRPNPPAEAVIRRLESTALQRNVTEFARMLERGLSVSREIATRVAHDPSGEGIVVAAKALGMKADVLQRILLFLNPAIGQSVARVFELAQLYEDITWRAAESMVAIWRQSGERLRPRHVPVLADDESSTARARATPGRYRSPRTGDAMRPLRHTGAKL